MNIIAKKRRKNFIFKESQKKKQFTFLKKKIISTPSTLGGAARVDGIK